MSSEHRNSGLPGVEVRALQKRVDSRGWLLKVLMRQHTAIEGPSMWKYRRAAGRVSEKPNPSAPSEANSCGTHWAIWSWTARMKSDTATTGPGASWRRWVT